MEVQQRCAAFCRRLEGHTGVAARADRSERAGVDQGGYGRATGEQHHGAGFV